MPKYGNSAPPQNVYEILKISNVSKMSYQYASNEFHNGFLILVYSHFISFFHYLPKCTNMEIPSQTLIFLKNMKLGKFLESYQDASHEPSTIS